MTKLVYRDSVIFDPEVKPVVFVRKHRRSSKRYQRAAFYSNYTDLFCKNIPIWGIIGNERWIQGNGSACILKPKITVSDVLYDLEREILVI